MSGLNASHARWLEEERKIDVELATRYGVHSRGPHLLFPYMAGEVTAYSKVRMPGKTWRCEPAGVPQTRLWNEDALAETPGDRDMLIITEGELDALAMLQAGFQFVVSVPSGASAKVARYLAVNGADEDGSAPTLKPDVAKFKRVVLLADCDQDGLKLREALVAFIGSEFCWLPTYPEGCKDANDVLVKFGVEKVRDLVDAAQPLKSDGFVPLTQIEQQDQPPTYSTGMRFLDPHLKLTVPEFVVVAGTSGAGKSTFVQAMVFGLAWEHRMRVSIFNGEGHEALVLQRARKFWRYKADKIDNDLTRQERVERDHWIEQHIALIKPPQDELPTFEWLLWAMEQQALNRKRTVLVIDPWNEVMHVRDKHVSTTEYTGEAIIRMKRLATRLGLILVVSHHVRKPDERRQPSMYDIADSAHWYNKADHGILLHRKDETVNCTTVHVAKSKSHEFMGHPGKVHVKLMPMAGNAFGLLYVDPPAEKGKVADPAAADPADATL